MPTSLRVCLLLACLSVLGGTIGCDPGAQKTEHVATVVPTPAERIKGWADSVAQSGELDSGAEVMTEEIEKLRTAGTPNADAISKAFDEVRKSAGNPTQVKAKAKALSDLLTK